MKINLKDIKIKFLQKKPFIIFVIEDFLTDSQYEYLKKNFPNPDFSNLKSQNKRYSLSSRNKDIIKKFFNKNNSMNDVENYFNSNQFKSFVINRFKFEYFKRLLKDILLFNFSLRNLRYIPRLFVKDIILLFKGLKLLRKKNHNYLKTYIEYSFIMNQGCLGPHTDSRGKILSLMLYFPEFEKNDKFFKKELNTGTSFYDCKTLNKGNTRLLNDDAAIFEKKYKVSNQLEFRKKNLYGFMRCAVSWHNVKEFDLYDDYIRRSINIDVLVK